MEYTGSIFFYSFRFLFLLYSRLSPSQLRDTLSILIKQDIVKNNTISCYRIMYMYLIDDWKIKKKPKQVEKVKNTCT